MTKKTKLMLFGVNGKTEGLNLIFNDCVLEFVNVVKYLGVFIDNRLKWTNHVDKVVTQLYKSIAMLRLVRECFSSKIKMIIYNNYFMSYVNYCSEIWGNCNIMEKKKIIVAQKKAIRLIFNMNYMEHVMMIAKRNEMLYFDVFYKFKLLL
jgi:hypothetical protein